MSGTSASVRTRCWTSGASSSRAARAPGSGGRNSAARRTKSPVGSMRMYWALMCVSFLTSKNAGAGLTSSSRNMRDELLDRAHLDVVARPPAQQGEVVAHRGSEEAARLVVGDGDVVAPLGELLALLVDQQRQVGEDGQRPELERLPEQDVARRVADVVLAADDVGDAHVGVVDGVGHDEQRCAGGAQDDEVVEVPVLHPDLPAHDVRPRGLALERACGTAAPGPARARGRDRGRSRRSRWAARRAPRSGRPRPRACTRTSTPARSRRAARRPRRAAPGGRTGAPARRPIRCRARPASRGCCPSARGGCARRPCPRCGAGSARRTRARRAS